MMIFFLAPCIGRRGSQTGHSTLARDCTYRNAFALMYISVRRMSFTFPILFSIFNFCERRKKFVFRTCVLKYNFFFYKVKAESSLHICVKFSFSHVCRTH